MTLQSSDGTFTCSFRPWTQKNITAPLTTVNSSELKQRYQHQQSLPLETVDTSCVDVLIGLDTIAAHRVLEKVAGEPDEPIGRHLPLGWVCLGPTGAENSSTGNILHVTTPDTRRLDNLVERFWDMEEVGMQEVPSVTEAERTAMAMAKASTTVQGKRVVAAIPWVHDDQTAHVKDNREMAKHRLCSLERSLAKTPDVQAAYHLVIETHLRKGYITRIESNFSKEDEWYLPHFPIV